MIPRILAIAGSDSGGGAGIQADIKTITMLGGHAMTAITAITAQNTVGVTRVDPVAPEMVMAQIDAVVSDIGIDAIKIGMLGSAALCERLAERLAQPDLDRVPVIFDPVMIATSGAILADAATARSFARLFARSRLITPNLDELAALSGLPVDSEEAIGAAAARLISELEAESVLVTGVPATDARLSDLLYVGAGAFPADTWSDTRIQTDQDHGTGCTLSSAIATGVGSGWGLGPAIERARAYVRAVLAAAPGLGRGHGPMGHGLERLHRSPSS